MFAALRRWFVLATLPILTLGGCAPDDEDRVEVHGVVRFRGETLTGGAIVFTPDVERGTPDEMLFAKIDANGGYQLMTEFGNLPAPGWYRISISGKVASGATVPERYRDPSRSGLERRIRVGQDNVIDFDLD